MKRLLIGDVANANIIIKNKKIKKIKIKNKKNLSFI